jgi:hypothetical protein
MDQAQIQRMFADLSRRGIEKSTYAPPIYRLARKLGFNLIPPLLAPFRTNVLLFGIYFSVFFGAFVWLMHWSHTPPQNTPAWGIALLAVLSGLLFGVCVGWWYRNTALKHGLPSWEQYRRQLEP